MGKKLFILSGWGMHVTFDPSELAYSHTVDVLAHTIPFTPVNRGKDIMISLLGILMEDC